MGTRLKSFHFGSSNEFTLINFWSLPLLSLINFRSCRGLCQLSWTLSCSAWFSAICLCCINSAFAISSAIFAFSSMALSLEHLLALLFLDFIFLLLPQMVDFDSIFMYAFVADCSVSASLTNSIFYVWMWAHFHVFLQTTILHQLTSHHVLRRNDILDVLAQLFKYIIKLLCLPVSHNSLISASSLPRCWTYLELIFLCCSVLTGSYSFNSFDPSLLTFCFSFDDLLHHQLSFLLWFPSYPHLYQLQFQRCFQPVMTWWLILFTFMKRHSAYWMCQVSKLILLDVTVSTPKGFK